MSDERERGLEPRRRRSERKRRRSRRRRAHRAEPEAEEADLSPEERRYREAEERAEQKVELAGDTLKLGVIVAVLAVLKLWFVAVLVIVFGGHKVLRRLYRALVEPRLRARFVEEEVRRQVRETLSEERRLMEGQHARSMEQLSASIAHEIRNPITAAKSLVQQMGEDLAAAENVEYAKVALEELGRVERSVSHLLRFAREQDLEPAEVRMAEVIDSALETFRDRAERDGVTLEQHIDCQGLLIGDKEKLRRVVINLVGNAFDAVAEGGGPKPAVAVEMGENLAGSEVWVRVRDNGPGMDAETQARVFEPFFTSKADGTGLGLAITRKLVEAHGGRIEIESEPGRGVAFLLTFPKPLFGEEPS